MKNDPLGKAILAALGLVLIFAHCPPVGAQPLHFKELLPFLPTTPPQGWQVSEKPRGTTIKSPIPLTEVEVHFQSGEKTLAVTISDGLPAVAACLSLAPAMEMESSEEYTKPVEIQGFRGIETYHAGEKRGEINLPVAHRFLVSLTAQGVEDTRVLREVAAKMNLKKLDKLGATQK